MSSFDFGVKNLSEELERVDVKIRAQASEHIDGVNRLLQTRGKQLRPSLVIAVVYHNGYEINDNVINLAAAVELVHLASLVHDDLMDNGSLRHGVPTINAKEGNDSAIISGDYLLAKACLLAAEVSAEAAGVLANTIANLCEGQSNELKHQFNLSRTSQSLLSAAEGKTSALFICSVSLGGMVSGMDQDEIKVLTDFAQNFGVAFQYKDDVQDFIMSPETAGKSVGNDISEGNYTLPIILSLQGVSGSKLEDLLKKQAPIQQVVDLLEKDGSIERTLEEVQNYQQKAQLELKKLNNTKLADALDEFLDYFRLV